MKRVAILGTGAVGGYYGGVLARRGVEVHFIARSEYRPLLSKGLSLDTDDGIWHVHPVHAHANAKSVPPCDVVLVTLKTTQLDALSDYLPQIVADDGIVVALQNGLGAEDVVARFVPAHRVWGAICFLCAIRTGPACVQQRDRKAIRLAPFTAGQWSPAVEWLLENLQSAGVPAAAERNLALLRWNKLLWNIPYNGLCALLRQSTSEVSDHPATRALVIDLMQEVRAACAAVVGEEIHPSRIDQLLEMTDGFDHYRPSMLIDAEAGRELELDSIYGEPIARARAEGVTMPRTETLLRLLLASSSAAAVSD